MAHVGRPWTPAEDRLLRDAVAIHGDDTERWKTIALSVPGRTNKACRKRWLHSLCPTVKKSAWTQEEDTKLLALFARYPNKWSQIAREIPGRTDDACSKRYREALDPNLKKEEWTEEEDKRLLECYVVHGGKWGAIGLALRRSGLGCRNRWRLLERKKNSASRQVDVPSQRVSNPPSSSLHNTSLAENPSIISYWNSTLGNWNFNVESTLDPSSLTSNHEFPAGDFITNCLSSNSLVDTAIDRSSFTSGPPAAVSFNFASSSLSSALTEPDASVQQNAESSVTSCNVANDDIGIDDAGSENWDFGMNMDDDPVEDLTESANPIEAGPTSAVQASLTPSDEEDIDQPSNMAAEPRADSFQARGNIPANTSVVEESSPQAAMMSVISHYPDRSRSRAPKRRRTNPQYAVQVDSVIGRETKPPPKLSSTLPVATDGTVLAYACGSHECWQTGSARFSTSGELLEHYKAEHALEPCGSQDTPFRCGLRDCAKGWKSINGLQYHLQISKAHFKRVLSSVALQKNQQQSASVELPGPSDSPSKKRKTHDCPFEDCPKSYKQLSGLRYHLQHGHSDTLPLQLDVVPPTIARRMGVEQTVPSVPITVPPAPS